MENMVNLICNGATEFTPDMLVRLVLVVLVLDCISSVAFAITSFSSR